MKDEWWVRYTGSGEEKMRELISPAGRSVMEFGDTCENWSSCSNEDMRRIADCLNERAVLKEALFPRPEIKGCEPLILYFDTPADREEFVEAVKSVKPNMRSYKV